MPYSPRISFLEYALIVFVVVAAIVLFSRDYMPIFGLIADGAKLAIALINGDAAAIGSLLPAAK